MQVDFTAIWAVVPGLFSLVVCEIVGGWYIQGSVAEREHEPNWEQPGETWLDKDWNLM